MMPAKISLKLRRGQFVNHWNDWRLENQIKKIKFKTIIYILLSLLIRPKDRLKYKTHFFYLLGYYHPNFRKIIKSGKKSY